MTYPEDIEDDGFITVHPPCGTRRNHTEEIRNAMAAEERRKKWETLLRARFDEESG
jgi:hypothetical protein